MTAITSTYAADVSDQLGAVKPHVSRAANIIANALGITEMSGYGQRSGVSDHPSGLAIDIPATRATGDQVAAFVTKNAGPLGVKYVIWQQAIWKPASGAWAPMATKGGDRPGYDPNHLRHVHVSFTDAAPAEADASALERAVGVLTFPFRAAGDAISGAAGNLAGIVRGSADAINPLDDWAVQGMAIGLKIAAVAAGLTLVVIGASRLVAPAVTSTIDKAVEVVT